MSKQDNRNVAKAARIKRGDFVPDPNYDQHSSYDRILTGDERLASDLGVLALKSRESSDIVDKADMKRIMPYI